jgi:hypothetical protein
MKKIILMLASLMLLIAACAPANSSKCNYSDQSKNYIGKSQDECSRIKFMCVQSMEYFSDECGCGCRPKEEGKLKATDCEIPRPEICTKEYNPVCGWFDPVKIQCIRYPCAVAYGNKCEACADDKVISWTEGECPK